MTHAELIKTYIKHMLTEFRAEHNGHDIDNIYNNYYYIIGAINISYYMDDIKSTEYQELSFLAREEKDKAVDRV